MDLIFFGRAIKVFLKINAFYSVNKTYLNFLSHWRSKISGTLVSFLQKSNTNILK